jgi:hypothetical protein
VSERISPDLLEAPIREIVAHTIDNGTSRDMSRENDHNTNKQTHWPKEIAQKEKQRSKKHTYTTKDTDFTRFEKVYTDRKSVGG